MRYICLRDDDTKYYTSVEELKLAYGEFWNNIPITLATIPFAHGSCEKILEMEKKYSGDFYSKTREWEQKASAKELTEYVKVKPIGENEELVNELKRLVQSGMIEIAQHGVNHKYNEFGPEMISNRMGYVQIREAHEYLEKLFDTKITTFIPPSNTIDPICVEWVKSLGMHLFCRGSIKYKSRLEMLKWSLCDLESVRDKIGGTFVSDRPYTRRCGVYQFGSITYGKNCEYNSIIARAKAALDKTGFVALGTHYMLLLDAEYRKNYHRMIAELLEQNDVTFVTASVYYDKMMEKYHAK